MKSSASLLILALPISGCAPSAQGAASSSQASGRLAPIVIQRIVRSHFDAFRRCYEDGLRRQPWLRGRVSVRFVIGRDGAVSRVGDGGSDIPDAGVVSCVLREFSTISFPQPEGGFITVTYPIEFDPDPIAHGPTTAVSAGMFEGCQASRGDQSGGTVATIVCSGYSVRVEEIPLPLSEPYVRSAVSSFAVRRPKTRLEQGPTTMGGPGAWTATAVEPSSLWARVVIVPIGSARLRVVECDARPPAASNLHACDEAISRLATTPTLADVLAF